MVKMPKIRGIFDHAKPRIISSYNSRAAPSPHTLMRPVPRRASRRRLAASAPSLPTSPRVPATRLRTHLAPKCTKAGPEG